MSNNLPLHPVWRQLLGLPPEPPPPPQSVAAATAVLTAALTRQSLAATPPLAIPAVSLPVEAQGWVATCAYRPANGTPVGVKKRLSQSVSVSTTLLPGDARYPTLDPSRT